MLELASLKFSVDTKELESAANKLDDLVKKAGNLGKVTKELAASEKNLAVAAKESAKAADLNAAAELKLAKARSQDAAANERNAKASKALTEAQIKQSESSQRIATAQEKQSKATKVTVDNGDRLIKLYSDMVSKANFVEQGFSRTEASLLTLATNLGATTNDVKDFADVFDRIRKVIGGDPFDKSGSSLKRLQQELDISKKLTASFGEAGALTKKQIADLGRDLERTAALGKQFNLSQQEIEKEQNRIQKEFLETAKSLNDQNAALKRLERGTKDNADAHVNAYEREKKARAQAVEGFAKYIQKVELTKSATKELYSQGVFSRTTINQFVELERKAKEAGISIERVNEIKERFARADAGNAGLKFQADLIAGLTRQVVTLGAAYASVQGVLQGGSFFIRTADEMKLLKSRLDIAGEGTVNFKRDFTALVKIANDARTPIESVTTVFTRLVPIMPAMGKGVKEATQVTEALTKMLRISGRGAQEASSAMLQFSQAMAKGKLDGDEFRSLAENLPEVLRVLEKQTGKTRAEIMLMSSAGMLTATMMTDAMIASLGKLDAQLAKMPETVEGATTVLKNNFTLLVQKMDEASGISDKLAGAVLNVSEGIKSLADAGPGVSALLAGITAFAGSVVIAGIGALAGKLVAVAAGYTGLFTAVSGFAAFLAANPIGLALVGIGLVAGVTTFVRQQETQVRNLKEGNDKLKNLTKERQELGQQLSNVMSGKKADGTFLNNVATGALGGLGKQGEIKRIQRQLEDNKKTEEALKRSIEQYNISNTKTAEEKFKASLSPAELSAPSLETLLKNSSFDKTKEGLAKEWYKSSSDIKNSLSAAIKKSENDYKIVVDEIQSSNLTKDEKDKKLADALKLVTDSKRNIASNATKVLAATKKDYDEAVKSLNKKESGPVKQASSEGYGVKNDGVIENLNKRYSAELKTIREGEKAKLDILSSSGAQGAELFQKQYQIMDDANRTETELSRQHFTEVKNQTQELISETEDNYEKFKKEQSGKTGFAEANQKMIEQKTLFINKLKDNLSTLSDQLDQLQRRNEIDLFKKLALDINKSGVAIQKLNEELVNLINKESELSAERTATEKAQIDSIGLTEQQIVMLKAETEERNRLNSQKVKLFNEAEKEKKNLLEMISKRDDLTASSLETTKAELDLNDAIAKQQSELDKLNSSMETYNGLLATLPAEAAARALRELNRKEVQEFSNKIADALNTGIFSGAKAGSRKLRQVIVDELKKPITVTVQALVSAGMNALTGGGSSGVLGGISNFLGLGKLASGASEYLGLGSLFGSGAGTAGASDAALASLGYAGPSALGAGAGATSGLMAGLGSAMSVAGPIAAALAISKGIAGDYKLAGLGDASFLLGGGLVARMFGMGSKKTTAQGITGTFGSGGFSGNTFQDWKQKGGWFRSDKSGTNLGALDSGIDKSLDDSFTALKLNAIASAKALGLTTDSIVNFSKTVRIEFTNNAEENNKKMQDMLDGMSDDIARILIPSIDSLAIAGEKAKDTFARLALNLTSVNSIVGLLGVKLIDVSVVGAQAATALSDMFGGIDKLKEATTTYYDAFYSQDEKMSLSLKVMTDAMKAVGLTLPATKEEFRKMVDVLDLNTEYGRNLYSVMVKIAPTFNEFTTTIDEVKTKVNEAASTLRDSIFEAKYGTMVPEAQLSTLKEQFDLLIAQAATQSGSELTATSEKISSSLQPLLEKVKDIYASGPEYFRLQDEILSKAGMIANRSDNLGTYEDRSLRSLNDISSILSKINESGQLTVTNLEKLINFGNSTNPVTSGTATGYAQATIVKANNEAAALIERLNAFTSLNGLNNQLSSSNNQLSALQSQIKDQVYLMLASGYRFTDSNGDYSSDNSVEGGKRAYDEYFGPIYGSMEAIIAKAMKGEISGSGDVQNTQRSIDSLNATIANLVGQQSILIQKSSGVITGADYEAKLVALRKQITDAGGVPAFANGAAFSNGVVKEPTLFNMGLMGEAGEEGILPLARTSSGALGVQSVGVGSQEVSERLVESNRHLGALVRLQQASNIKIIEKLSEVEQRLEGIETAARLEASA